MEPTFCKQCGKGIAAQSLRKEIVGGLMDESDTITSVYIGNDDRVCNSCWRKAMDEDRILRRSDIGVSAGVSSDGSVSETTVVGDQSQTKSGAVNSQLEN